MHLRLPKPWAPRIQVFEPSIPSHRACGGLVLADVWILWVAVCFSTDEELSTNWSHDSGFCIPARFAVGHETLKKCWGSNSQLQNQHIFENSQLLNLEDRSNKQRNMSMWHHVSSDFPLTQREKEYAVRFHFFPKPRYWGEHLKFLLKGLQYGRPRIHWCPGHFPRRGQCKPAWGHSSGHSLF